LAKFSASPLFLSDANSNTHLPAQIRAKQPPQDSDPTSTTSKDVAQNQTLANQSVAVTSKDGKIYSEILLEQIGEIIPEGTSLLTLLSDKESGSPSESASASESGQAAAPASAQISHDQIEEEIAQHKEKSSLTFTIYYKLLSKLIAFQRNPDKTVYSTWMGSSAEPLEKAIITVRNNLGSEKKGNVVDWAKINTNVTSLTNGEENPQELKNSVQQFEQARLQLQRLQKRVIDFCAKSKIDARPHLKSILDEMIHLFENKDNLTGKKRSLKTMLLSVSHSGGRNVIQKATLQELEILIKMYGI